MNKKKILFLSSWYPNSELPYNGNFVQQHARAVAKSANVAILHVQGREQGKPYEITIEHIENVYEVIVYFEKNKNVNYVSKLIKQKTALFKGYTLIENYFNGKPDITHLNVILPLGWYAYYLKIIKKIPYIITEHHSKYLNISNQKFTFLEKIIIKKVVKKSSMVCPVSNNLKEAMLSKGFVGNYKIVPNVVNNSIFTLKEVKSDSKFTILHVSSLVDHIKNISGIIRVFKKLTVKFGDKVFLHIIGDGDKDRIDNWVANYNLGSSHYKIEGPKNYQEIAKAMQNASVFVLFSNYENLPCVIAESLVCGTPVIATKVGGIPEMIDETNGLLIDAKDEDALLNKIEYFIENQHQYDNTLISKNAIEKYSYQKVSEQFLNIYKNILQ